MGLNPVGSSVPPPLLCECTLARDGVVPCSEDRDAKHEQNQPGGDGGDNTKKTKNTTTNHNTNTNGTDETTETAAKTRPGNSGGITREERLFVRDLWYRMGQKLERRGRARAHACNRNRVHPCRAVPCRARNHAMISKSIQVCGVYSFIFFIDCIESSFVSILRIRHLLE